MSSPRPIHWYHSRTDPVWLDVTLMFCPSVDSEAVNFDSDPLLNKDKFRKIVFNNAASKVPRYFTMCPTNLVLLQTPILFLGELIILHDVQISVILHKA
jgi:hypothetical protein